MADPLYTRAAASALRMLTKYGADVTLRTIPTGSYNTSTRTVTAMPADTTRKGLLLDFDEGQTLENGETIQKGDKKMYLDASGVAPKLKDELLDAASVIYSIIGVGTLSPAGVPVLYTLHLRA